MEYVCAISASRRQAAFFYIQFLRRIVLYDASLFTSMFWMFVVFDLSIDGQNHESFVELVGFHGFNEEGLSQVQHSSLSDLLFHP
jgi:hypothetical protein